MTSQFRRTEPAIWDIEQMQISSPMNLVWLRLIAYVGFATTVLSVAYDSRRALAVPGVALSVYTFRYASHLFVVSD